MTSNQKKSSQLPVDEIWDGDRLVSMLKIRDLNASDIVDLLGLETVRFVVADVGEPYRWIPHDEQFDFWKDEVKPHLAQSDSATLENFPDEYCYFASEWKSYNDETIILLSKAH